MYRCISNLKKNGEPCKYKAKYDDNTHCGYHKIKKERRCCRETECCNKRKYYEEKKYYEKKEYREEKKYYEKKEYREEKKIFSMEDIRLEFIDIREEIERVGNNVNSNIYDTIFNDVYDKICDTICSKISDMEDNIVDKVVAIFKPMIHQVQDHSGEIENLRRRVNENIESQKSRIEEICLPLIRATKSSTLPNTERRSSSSLWLNVLRRAPSENDNRNEGGSS